MLPHSWLTLVCQQLTAVSNPARKRKVERASLFRSSEVEQLEERQLLTATVVDFETGGNGAIAANGTSFSSGGQSWTLTGFMVGVQQTSLGSSPVGSATPASNGYLDTGYGVARSTGDIGGIKVANGFIFRTSGIDIWPSSNEGNSVVPYVNGINNVPGETGHNFNVRGLKNGSTVVNITVKDTLRTPPQSGNVNGGYWHHLELTGTAFDTTDIDQLEIFLVTATGTATDGPNAGSALTTPDYVALDNFVYYNLGAGVTNNVPVAQASSVTTNEDTAKTFAVSDFQFTDTESDPLASITIGTQSLASGDTLTVNQGAGQITVTNGMTITAAQIPSLTYTPASNQSGSPRSTFTFKVNDGGLGTVAATMSINVNPVNDVPVAQASSVTTNEDTAKTFATSDFQFTDVESNALVSITIGTQTLASGDTLTVNQGAGQITVTNGMTITAAQIASLTYTPASNQSGSPRSTFTFKVNDAGLGTVAATMSINVTAVNDVPVAQASSVTTNEDIAKTFATSDFQFTDVESNALVSITIGTQSLASGDTLTVNQGAGQITVTNGMTITAAQIPSLTYTPASNANGSGRSSFTFKVNDAGLGTVVATMTINVTAVNDVPVAQASSVTTNQDTAKTFATSDFLFADVESNSLVSITVSSLALASGDTLTVDQGAGAVTVTNGMTITAAQIPTLTYRPGEGASGSARSTFSFKVNDSGLGTVAATMTINVSAVNSVPVAQASSVTTNEDTAKPFAVSDFHFTDADSDSLVSITVSSQSLASGDTLTVDQGAGQVAVTNGMTITAAQIPSLTYTPASNANGTARSTFSFKVNDSGLGTVAATMTINVTAVNDVPVAQASSVTTNEDTAKTFAGSDFLFTDVESDSLVSITVSSQSLASGDTLTVNQGAGQITVTNGMTITAAQIPSLTYTPASNANGSARSSFSFNVNDTGLGTVAATMTINVTAVNDVPVAQASSITTNEDIAKTFATSDFLYTDVESDSLVSITVSGVSLASGDTLTVNQGAGAVAVSNGMTITAAQIPTMTYTPFANANGAARSSFSFKVNDSGSGTVAATMNINVTPVNDPPTITSGSTANVMETRRNVFALTATDLDADAVTFSVTGGADGSKFEIVGGVLRFITSPVFSSPSDANHDGVYIVQVTADDGHGGTVNKTVSVTVTKFVDQSIIIDNQSPSGYSETGSWRNRASATLLGYLGNLRYSSPNVTVYTGNANDNGVRIASAGDAEFATADIDTATWTFTGLQPGTYQVAATWFASTNRASNASFSVTGTGNSPQTFVINERNTPASFTTGSSTATGGTAGALTNWQTLVPGLAISSANGTITVTLTSAGANGYVIADAIRIEPVDLQVASQGSAANPVNQTLTENQVESVVEEAITRWKATGLSASQLGSLNNLHFEVQDLPDAELGGQTANVIYLDKNAAGYGWFIDSTPHDNSEFGIASSATERRAGAGSVAAGKMDLLTVVMHEIGHRLGYGDSDDPTSLMSTGLDVGIRRSPAAKQTAVKHVLTKSEARAEARTTAKTAQAAVHHGK